MLIAKKIKQILGHSSPTESSEFYTDAWPLKGTHKTGK